MCFMFLLSVRYVVLDVKRKCIGNWYFCFTGVLHSSTSEVAAWVIVTQYLTFPVFIAVKSNAVYGAKFKNSILYGEYVQRECALAGGMDNARWLFLYWNELYSVLFISLCACHMLYYCFICSCMKVKIKCLSVRKATKQMFQWKDLILN